MFLLMTIRSFSNYDLIVSDWIFTQFFFNYEYEYIKRGLLGELLRIYTDVPSMGLIIFISLINNGSCCLNF